MSLSAVYLCKAFKLLVKYIQLSMKNLLFFIYLALLPITMGAYANNAGNPLLKNPKVSTNTEVACALDAPNNLVATIAVASSTVSLTWDAVPGAVDYEIKTYESTSGNLVSTNYTTATNFMIQPGMPQCYTFVVRAGCGAGEYSPNSSSDEACLDWVIDLVINGYQCPSSQTIPSIISIPPGGSISIPFTPGNSYEAKLRRISNSGVFLEEKKVRFGQISSNTTNSILFKQASLGIGTLVTETCVNTGIYLREIYLATCAGSEITRLVTFSLSVDNGNSIIIEDTDNLANYTVDVSSICISKNPSKNEPELSITPTAAPNPFDNEIALNLSAFANLEEDISLQLFDITGKVCYSEDHVDSFSPVIPTTDLSTGIYFLRVRVGDIVETMKMVKSK